MVALFCVLFVCATVAAVTLIWTQHLERVGLQKTEAAKLRDEMTIDRLGIQGAFAETKALSERLTAMENRIGPRR